MKVYTKTGDNFETSAIRKRLYKDNNVFDCLGTIDELQSHLMVVANLLIENDKKFIGNDVRMIVVTLKKIVQDLFDLGRDLLMYQDVLYIRDDQVVEFEDIIDDLDSNLPKLNDFIYPGHSVISSQLHVARSVSRRLERHVVGYGKKKKKLNKNIFSYLNRLSDLLYVFARFLDSDDIKASKLKEDK